MKNVFKIKLTLTYDLFSFQRTMTFHVSENVIPLFFAIAKKLERVMGIEPTTTAWKAVVLPLNYTRKYIVILFFNTYHLWPCMPQSLKD